MTREEEIEYLLKNKEKCFFTNLVPEKVFKECFSSYIESNINKFLSFDNSDIDIVSKDSVLQVLMKKMNLENSSLGSENLNIAIEIINDKIPWIMNSIYSLNKKASELISDIKPTDSMNKIVSAAKMSYITGITLPYQVSEILLKKSYVEPSRYPAIALKSAFISLGQKKMHDNGEYHMAITFADFGNFEKYGECGISYIRVSDNVFDMFYYKENKKRIFETIFHETEHSLQNKLMSENHFSFKNMIFIKDKLLSVMNKEYYKDNYKNIFIEIYARISGELETNKYLRYLCDEEYDSSIENKNIINEEVERVKKRVNSNMKDFNERFMSIDNAPRKNMFDHFPILSVEYNYDGSSKSICEILDYVNNKLKKDTPSMFTSIFKKEQVIDFKAELYSYVFNYLKQNKNKLKEEYDEVLNYKTNDKVLNSIISNALSEVRSSMKELDLIDDFYFENSEIIYITDDGVLKI